MNQHTFLIEVDQTFFHAYLENTNFSSRIFKLYSILNKTENNYKHIEIKYFTSKGFTYSYFTTFALLYLGSELSLKKQSINKYNGILKEKVKQEIPLMGNNLSTSQSAPLHSCLTQPNKILALILQDSWKHSLLTRLYFLCISWLVYLHANEDSKLSQFGPKGTLLIWSEWSCSNWLVKI